MYGILKDEIHVSSYRWHNNPPLASPEKEILEMKTKHKQARECALFLIEKGACCRATPYASPSAFEAAMKLRDIKLVKMIFNKGHLDPNELSSDRCHPTPLLLASVGRAWKGNRRSYRSGGTEWRRHPLPRRFARKQSGLVTFLLKKGAYPFVKEIVKRRPKGHYYYWVAPEKVEGGPATHLAAVSPFQYLLMVPPPPPPKNIQLS